MFYICWILFATKLCEWSKKQQQQKITRILVSFVETRALVEAIRIFLF